VNAIGKQIQAIDPLGREIDYVYGNNNTPDTDPVNGTGMDLLQVKRKNGSNYDVLTTYTYNAQHQPLTIADARGATTTYTYNSAGQVLTVTTPPAQGQSQGATTTSTYDTNGYLTQLSGPVPGATRSFTYDSYGRRRTVTDPAALTLTFDYDALDRVTQLTYPDGTSEQTTYNRLDAEGTRDRLGRWSRSFHDALRRVVATRDPAGGTTQYQYGGSGCSSCGGGGDQLTAIVDPNGNQTSWTYDAQGRVVQETRADGSSGSYIYETTSSRLKQRTDRKGVTTTLAYYLDNKLASKSFSDTTPAVSYTYDAVTGQMLTVANGTDTLTWTYDNLDRPATEASTRNASTVGYSYDDAGNRVALIFNGSAYLTYGYDQPSRLTAITYGAQSFGFSYDTTSRRTAMTYPNGVVTSYGYDTESRLTSLGASLNGTPITSFGYVLDAAGNRTSKTTLDWTDTYGYDAANRLVSADRATGTPSRWRFAYDPVGNRTGDQTDDAAMAGSFNNVNELQSRQAGGALTFKGTTSEPATLIVAGKTVQTSPAPTNAFSAQAPIGAGTSNVVVSATDPSGNTRTNTYQVSASGAGASYTYDPNGNLATKTEGTNVWNYTWDAENRLTQVQDNGAAIATFAYDPLGRRVQKIAGGVTTNYTYDGAAILRELRGATTLKYVQGRRIDEPLAVDDGASLTYFHADALGSIMKTTNVAGAATSSRQYDAWGNLQVGMDQPGYAFSGREWDPETGLYYYRARYYDPKPGRFISEDPIGIEGGINPYIYVEDDPANATDPEGLCPKSLDMGYEDHVIGPGASAPGYQAETRSRVIWFLVRKSGECCEHKMLECTYALIRNYQRRTRPFTGGQFGPWSPWTFTAYRRFMEVTTTYNCDTGVMNNFRYRSR
jgi:RHS repeat-associated protein